MEKEKFGLKNFIFFVIPFLMLTVYACSSMPSEADARKVFENSKINISGSTIFGTKMNYETEGFAEKIKDGTIKIQSFRKVNGLLKEESGVKFYTIEYEAKIEFLRNDGKEKKGDVKVIYGKIEFVKKEKGWEKKTFVIDRLVD